jgi:hypothetical protein
MDHLAKALDQYRTNLTTKMATGEIEKTADGRSVIDAALADALENYTAAISAALD